MIILEFQSKVSHVQRKKVEIIYVMTGCMSIYTIYGRGAVFTKGTYYVYMYSHS